MNQQGNCGQNYFGQPMQQDQQFANYNQQQQQQQNSYAQNLQSANPCLCTTPGIGQSQTIPCSNYLPHNIMEQIRACVGNAAPIFILPNSQPIQTQQLPQVQQNLTPQAHNVGYQNGGLSSSMANGYPVMGSNPIFTPPCYPIPIPVPFCNAFANHQNKSQFDKNSTSCDHCRRNNDVQMRNSGMSEDHETHRCCPGNDDTICTKPNCPASINLQALASQLLSIQGVIPCAATRLVLRKVPGSNVTTTVEDTMDRAQKSIGLLNKDQLINEARNAQHVNGLINLHMMASPPQNIVPALTMLQLKVNSLKAIVENLINKSLSECQSVGVDGNTNLEPMMMTMKSDAELRELLAILRQKECEERVNVNYAPYHSQKVVAESRLNNFQNKIKQVETEMERRRASAMPWLYSNGQLHKDNFFKEGNCTSDLQGSPVFDTTMVNQYSRGKGFDSPSPFMVQVQNPRRLNLKPNVGGPQTTYDISEEERIMASQMRKSEINSQGCCKDGESWDNRENALSEPSREDACSSDVNGGKKKLKIHVDDRGELSVKKKSLEEFGVGESFEISTPDVVIVIDNKDQIKDSKDEDVGRKKLRNKKKTTKKKKSEKKISAESVPSNSTCGSKSETSVSSENSEAEETRIENKTSKSILKNVLKGKKKKTPMSEEDVNEKTIHDVTDKSESLKKEKHVNVAVMLSEICNDDPFNSGSEILTILENRRGRKKFSEPLSGVEENGDDDRCSSRSQERLDIIRENADDIENLYVSKNAGENASNEICSIMREKSSSSIISFGEKHLIKNSREIFCEKNGNAEENCGLGISRNSKKLNEAQNQKMGRFVRSNNYVVESNKEKLKKKKTKKTSKSDDKENVIIDVKTCSIIGKKNIDTECFGSKASCSSVDLNHRKRFNHRFK